VMPKKSVSATRHRPTGWPVASGAGHNTGNGCSRERASALGSKTTLNFLHAFFDRFDGDYGHLLRVAWGQGQSPARSTPWTIAEDYSQVC
jgi:hypothetical protein